MSPRTLHDLEEAILRLTPNEREGLFARFESPIDARIGVDIAAGRLDHLINQALQEDAQGTWLI